MARASAFNATPYSVFALRPAAWTGEGEPKWEHWDVWAKRNGILDKNGEPSLKKGICQLLPIIFGLLLKMQINLSRG